MAKKADYDDQQAREAVARAIMDDSDVSAAGGSAAALGANPNELFCKNWDMVKQVLQFLKPFLPKVLRGVVDIIIKAGDALKSTIC